MKRSLYSALTLALMIAGCSQSTAPEIRKDSPTLIGPTWLLVKIDGEAAPSSEHRAGDPFTILRFVDNLKFTGWATADNYDGDYHASTGSLRFDSIASTSTSGTPGDIQFENRYLTALRGVTRFELSGTNLTLFYGDGGTLVYILGENDRT